jgi:hypothetical protein
MAMAVDAFHVQIAAQGTEVTDLVLKLGMKSSSGPMAWAPLRPEQWTDIIRDGDEIQLGSGSAEDMGLNIPGPLISFRCRKIDTTPKKYNYITILLPKTCEVRGVRTEMRISWTNISISTHPGPQDHYPKRI